jgi:hypothetical protein
MNTLVLLMATSFASAGDPVTVIQYSPTPTPASVSPDTGWTGQSQDSRPRFFPRIRALFSRRSQTGDQMPPDSYPSYQRGASVSTAVPNSTVISPAPISSSPSVYSGPTGPSISAPAASSSTPSYSTPQRMPTGNPF